MVIGGWWRTYHNEDADAITRLSAEDVEGKIKERGWSMVDLRQAVRQALEDTERFGPCFLSWHEEGDRYEQMNFFGSSDASGLCNVNLKIYTN